MAARKRLKVKGKVVRAVRPNVGLEMLYRKRLYKLVDDMCRSVQWWVTAGYRRIKPELAMDAPSDPPVVKVVNIGGARPWMAMIGGQPLRADTGYELRFATEENARRAARRFLGEMLPADEMQAVMADLTAQWQSAFDEGAERMARSFSKDSSKFTDTQMRKILADAGFTVRFAPTPAQLDVLRASVHENVALIKSIPQQYLKNVEGLVMRSVQRGRDLSTLYEDLQKQHGVTRRRAALIARDQNNKATSVFQETRRKELGITQAIWMHSHGGKTPRPTHVAMDGKLYDVNKGMWDSHEGKYVFPGQLINCRCVSKSVIPALGS